MKMCPECCDGPYGDKEVSCAKCGEVLEKINKDDGKPKEKKKVNVKGILYGFLGILLVVGSCFSMYINLPDKYRFLSNNQVEEEPFSTGESPSSTGGEVSVPVVIPAVIDPSTIQLVDRYFTQSDFSLVVDRDFLQGNEVIVHRDSGSDMTALPTALGQGEESIQGASTLYQFLWKQCHETLSLAYGSFNDQYSSLGELSQDMVTVTEAPFSVGTEASIHYTIQLNFDTEKGKSSAQYSTFHQDTVSKVQYYDLFHIPYPDSGGDYFQVLLFGGEPMDKVAYLPLIETMLNTFIPHVSLMEYDTTNGNAKFVTDGFTAYYSPNYIQGNWIPYYLDIIFANNFTTTMDVAYEEDSVLEGLRVQWSTAMGTGEGIGEEQDINGKTFHVLTTSVSVGEEEPVPLVYGFVYEGKSVEGVLTRGSLSMGASELAGMTFTSAEVNHINNMFQTVMETYQEAYSPSFMEYYEKTVTPTPFSEE